MCQTSFVSVKDALIAKVNWKDEQEIKYWEKYKEENRDGIEYLEWCQSEIPKVREELQEEKIRGRNEVREAQERVEAIREQLRSSELRRAESESEHRQILDQLRKAEERVAQLEDALQKKQSEKEKELAALTHHYEKQKVKEQEKVMTFVLRLEERDQHGLQDVAAKLDRKQLPELVPVSYTHLTLPTS